MSYRTVIGLTWAERRDAGPFGPSRSRRPALRAGISFERDLAKAIPSAWHGSWFEFSDRNGRGWCQPDLLLVGASSVLCLEAKYTWVESGHGQLEKLYRPVVELALGKPTLCVQVARMLTRETKSSAWVVGDLSSALALARVGKRVVLHWLGTGPVPLGPVTPTTRPRHSPSLALVSSPA